MSSSLASLVAFREPARALLASRLYLLPLVHLSVFCGSYALAFGLRFDFAPPETAFGLFWSSAPLLVALKMGVFYCTGNYHGWWRYVTFADLAAILNAATLSLLVAAAVDYFFVTNLQIPRAILLLDWAMTVLLMGGLRSCIRFSREHFWPMVRGRSRRKTLFVGADETSAALATRIHRDARLPYRIVGFLDPDPRKRGTRLAGIPVLGDLEQLDRLAIDHGAPQILVTACGLNGQAMRALVKRCEQADLDVKVIPALDDLLSGAHRIEPRGVDIDDLLRREPVRLDAEAIGHMLQGKTVMVTGAGGSIGSEICRQLLAFQPAVLVLVENTENSLFHVERELAALDTPTEIHAYIADILDRPRMLALFRDHAPDCVFHAAAYKHVPLMEQNVGEAIKNNVHGTRQMADLANEFGVRSFVLISTDKAVHPTSVMGATKQMAERYVHALSQSSSTRFVVVRFGNVLGSAGSVIPIFQEQIRRGGPITVTDPRMTRYFMSIPEASQLVLQAAAMGAGGEIYVLDMGEPVRIVDLAQDLIRLSGLAPDDIEIAFTGMRPGEKLYEELYFDDEQTLPTPHPKVHAAHHRPFTLDEVRASIGELKELQSGPPFALRRKLMEIVAAPSVDVTGPVDAAPPPAGAARVSTVAK